MIFIFLTVFCELSYVVVLANKETLIDFPCNEKRRQTPKVEHFAKMLATAFRIAQCLILCFLK